LRQKPLGMTPRQRAYDEYPQTQQHEELTIYSTAFYMRRWHSAQQFCGMALTDFGMNADITIAFP